ncbi:NAD(P)H-dependent oxidoreductase [Spiroplasma platyhelix]|uniref:NAD(P)H-dependent oxidoreductase n=1 Tax=Spiroplasma platyhelix PALS-1 TaxID=1276218 RepID=A0A846U156_9MOLU|nr:NAD(P)H-dependent oxidoreductase [Spiroplasma platyhelix]MBE4703866.1 Glutathione-regulated potassium-efflux system ancillary protein KefF [Spiroplasma platyhelix PALS-1]NKE38239.1 NAD(P)H-dependent oxidoreductase [Spiroplasma platyhelix PALS-1]UJB29124.1 hypothetical protein SPLAT_v1c03600 [Spiroplasma platyhelix PALS-1]
MKEKKLLIIGHPEFSTNSNHNKNIFYLLNQEKIDQILLLEQEFNPETNSFNYENSLKALLEADHIIFFHPIWWYSVPWTMKLWMDSVLSTFYNTHKETKKKVSIIITCGRTEHFYNKKDLQNVLLPVIETYQYMGWNVDHIYPLYEIHNKTDKEWKQFATLINEDLLA